MRKEYIYKPPFRIGRKQKRAILDSNGIEFLVFPQNNKKNVYLFCNWLNKNYEKIEKCNETLNWDD